MLIVSNIYEVAFRNYSPFSTEMYNIASSGIFPCLQPLKKHTHITGKTPYRAF